MNKSTDGARRRKSSPWHLKYVCLVGSVAFPIGVIVGLNAASWGFLRWGFPVSSNDVNDELQPSFLSRWGSKLPHVPVRDLRPKHKLPEIPQGPPTEQYLKHQWSSATYELAYDSKKKDIEMAGISMTETLLFGETIMRISEEWLGRARRLRKYLTERKLNTVDGSNDDRSPFLTSLDMSDVEKWRLDNTTGFSCVGDTQHRPVMDMGLVIPMEMNKLHSTWALLESIRQFTVYPKEIVFVIGNVAVHSKVDLLAFLTVVKQNYVRQLPAAVSVQIWTSEEQTKPGDSRWFGFNQTTSEIVTLFDNDDYMHPQFFHIFWRIFNRRPELDFALMQYEGINPTGECSEDMFFPSIAEFLNRRQFSEEEVVVGESYRPERYAELWGLIPTFNKTWWLGNTDAEPGWGIPNQEWWDMGCHNGWSTFRRYVMEQITPPIGKFGGEDAIWNYRIGRAKFNYRCIELVMGTFLKRFCPTT